MRRLFWIFTLLVGCGGCLVSAQPGVDFAAGEEEAAAVEVTSVCFGKAEIAPGVTTISISKKRGSGVVVGPRKILTAFHVAGCVEAQVTIKFRNGDERLARVSAVAVEADVAQLEVLGAGDFKDWSTLGSMMPKEGDMVCLASALPRRGRSCGEVTTTSSDLPGNLGFMAMARPGNSGSGVYDVDGRLVGITIAMGACEGGHPCGGFATTLAGREWLAR